MTTTASGPSGSTAVTVPTLLLLGSDSPPPEAESTARVAAALSGARVVTLEGHGHVAMLTAPELFTAEVLDFLRAAPREAVRSTG